MISWYLTGFHGIHQHENPPIWENRFGTCSVCIFSKCKLLFCCDQRITSYLMWIDDSGAVALTLQVLILQSRGYHVPPKPTCLHPWKLTCPLKRDYFSREYIFQPLIFRGHVSFLWKIHEHNLFFRWPPKLLGETVQKPRKASVCPWSHHSNPRRWLMRNIWRPNRENLPWCPWKFIPRYSMGLVYSPTGFFIFTPYFRKWYSLTSIFFRWVETTK